MTTSTGRPAMRSPGRPPIRRDVERALSVTIGAGLTQRGRGGRVRPGGTGRVTVGAGTRRHALGRLAPSSGG
jgi:hypothetical protein